MAVCVWGMAVVSTNFPDAVSLYHRQKDGPADWLLVLDEVRLSFSVDTQYDYANDVFAGPNDTIHIKLVQGGEDYTVGSFFTQDTDRYLRWDEDEKPTYTLHGSVDDDSSQIVGQHSAAEYEGIAPGGAEWVVFNASESQTLAREPVEVVPEWISPGVLSLTDCGSSDGDIHPGDRTTISAVVDNPSYDPLAGSAVAFVGDAREAVAFEVPPRGEASVEATFEVTEYGHQPSTEDLRRIFPMLPPQ